MLYLAKSSEVLRMLFSDLPKYLWTRRINPQN